MPELPDVELYKRRLDAGALGCRIDRVLVHDQRLLKGLSAGELEAWLRGNRLERSRRHGKYLLVQAERGGWLVLHFGMTGELVRPQRPEEEPRYGRVRLDFQPAGHLVYVSRRMLGRIARTGDADAFVAAEGLGPDALDPELDPATFRARLGGGRRQIKAALMDQGVLAGIGNIYADEVLFQARIHPRTPLERLGEKELARLFAKLREVLETAIACGAGSEQLLERLPRGYLLPARKKGGRCPRCGHELATLRSGGRTGYHCPRCQNEA